MRPETLHCLEQEGRWAVSHSWPHSPSPTGAAPWLEACLQWTWVTDETSSIPTPQHWVASLLRGALHACRWKRPVLRLPPSRHQSQGFSRGARTDEDRLLWFLNAWRAGCRCLELKTLGQPPRSTYYPLSHFA